MLIILSPAKTMDMKTLGDTYPFTWPLFQQDADLLVGKMQQYGVEELQKLLKVSMLLSEISDNNVESRPNLLNRRQSFIMSARRMESP